MELLHRVSPQAGYTPVISREKHGLEYLEFGLLRLGAGEHWAGETGEYEATVVILGGRCSIESSGGEWENVGTRQDVFDGKATAAYLPAGSPFSVTAGDSGVQIAMCKARADAGPKPRLIPPSDVKSRTVGAHNWRREVQDIVGADVPAQRLLVGETYNEPGAWSSYPPHKHDVASLPDEVKLEEIYYFRVDPPQGFGIQRIYTADGGIDEVYAIKDGDTVVIPKGYHPVAAAPGYKVYYLWMLAGPERVMRPRDDADHAWVHQLEG
ncbi:MAG: 5-deoxy-glucuronate isomerase [Armatimonadota bacterium]|nr:MAG: 5-deoxy-glucuronate isomerase [Armatimonadota bacterium]